MSTDANKKKKRLIFFRRIRFNILSCQRNDSDRKDFYSIEHKNINKSLFYNQIVHIIKNIHSIIAQAESMKSILITENRDKINMYIQTFLVFCTSHQE